MSKAQLIITLVTGVLLFLWLIRFLYRFTKDRKARKEFQTKYDAFLNNHGELYEKLTVPMDEVDRKSIKNYYRFFEVFLSLFVILFFSLLYFNWPSSLLDYLLSGAFLTFLLIAFTILISTRKETLASNEKTTIKGVITNKTKEDDDPGYIYSIQISKRYNITISPADYKRLTFGDIVRIELLDQGDTIENKVTLIGKI